MVGCEWQRQLFGSGGSLRVQTATSQAHLSTRGVQAQKRVVGSSRTAAASVQVSHSTSILQLGLTDTSPATGDKLHTSGSFWELYDDAGADEKEPTGPEKPGTTSSRSGFLASETSWSNRSSSLGLPPSGARGGRQGAIPEGVGRPGTVHQVSIPTQQSPSQLTYPGMLFLRDCLRCISGAE